MVDRTGKSHFTQKNTENIIQSPEEIKLKKLEDIVQKLQQAIDKGNNLEQSHQEQGKRTTANKSNFSSPTSTRMKEDRSDREFLSNFMNIDEKNVIPPQKMHLLMDNDINQNISTKEKFQNLSNLMMDDKNITEFNFIRNSEDRVKLYLYSAFSKKSKEIFMNEKHPKQSKNQILFHKINDIHIPKFRYYPLKDLDKNENANKDYCLDNNDEEIKNKVKNESNNCINEEKKDKQNEKFEENYFRQENKGYFYIPPLIKISSKQDVSQIQNDCKTKNLNIFWDPEIDSDTLSYINHNFICIEDIYNNKNIDKEKNDKNEIEMNMDEESEPNIIPVIAKEIILEKNLENNILEQNEKKVKEKKTSDKINNKFIEFISIKEGVEKKEFQVNPNIKSQQKFDIQLKSDFNALINKYIEIGKNEYPKGNNLTPKKIERFLRFKFLKQSKQIDFSLNSEFSTQSGKKVPFFEQNENKKIIDKNLMYSDNDSEFNLSINSKKEIN